MKTRDGFSPIHSVCRALSACRATLKVPLRIAGMLLFLPLLAQSLSAQGTRISSTQAFTAGCSADELDGILLQLDLGVGTIDIKRVPSPARTDPEWARIITDSTKSVINQPLQLVEGFVTLPPESISGNHYQANAEVAEEDLGWTHYTHDYTIKLTPDSPTYDYVLSYHANPDGTLSFQPDMEVEWDSASLMDEQEGFQRIWGAVPEFAWPSYGDRIWVLGHWIFDCGHNGNSDARYVSYETEIHPPQALVTQRLLHTALDTFPRQRTSEPSYPDPESYLPVTGEPQPAVTTFPTQIPVTEADIFVSGNGGAANDLCSLVPASPLYAGGDSVISGNGYTHCGAGGHTNPVVAVNDRNYVFDIYPPITDFTKPDTAGASTMINGFAVYPWTVYPPTPDSSLQYRIVDHDSEIPAHTCGGTDTTNCTTVAPIICLIDNTTPPPNQSETGCPAVPARPTRLRVILPFNGANANYFAKSILVGWDDVPNPNICGDGGCNIGVSTFKVTLHKFTIGENGTGPFNSGDWRLFVNVNGQWRYMSPFFDTDNGINAFDGGDNVCGGEALTDNGDDDCFQFDKTPFIVNIAHDAPIHVGVGGFIARDVEASGNPAYMCRNYQPLAVGPGGCDPRITYDSFKDLAESNDDRIGTYEFDLKSTSNYNPPNPDTPITQFGCTIFTIFGCNISYSTTFTVEPVSIGTPPTSLDPVLGTPNFSGGGGTFVTSATPVTLSLATGSQGTNFQYRFHLQGAALPTFSSPLPFPVHWTSADLGGQSSVDVHLDGSGGATGDGPYDLQYSAEADWHLLEMRHTKTLILDNTPPATTFNQPSANAQYGHSDTLTLNYSDDDGTGSGVDATTIAASADSQSALLFCNSATCLNSGQSLYLESMSLGPHTFSVYGADNLGNAGTNSVTFTIAVTPDSLLGDVTDLANLGCISNISQSLTAKISAAKALVAKGHTQAAINTLAALINEVLAQAGKHIATTCHDPNGRAFDSVQFLIGDAQYLIATLASQLKPNPIMGNVLSSTNMPIVGTTVSLLTSSKSVAATATTDSAGFYYFPETSGLTRGSTYTVKTTVPKGYKSSTPASSAFTWSAVAVQANFTLQ